MDFKLQPQQRNLNLNEFFFLKNSEALAWLGYRIQRGISTSGGFKEQTVLISVKNDKLFVLRKEVILPWERRVTKQSLRVFCRILF